MAMTTANSTLLTRTEVWSSELKDILRDEMMAQNYVRMLDGFPDGNTFHIPSIGQAQVDNYSEDAAVTYRPLDTGEFTFTVDKYLSSASYMTKKAEQDTFYANELMSRFVPEQERAIMEHFEQQLWLLLKLVFQLTHKKLLMASITAWLVVTLVLLNWQTLLMHVTH